MITDNATMITYQTNISLKALKKIFKKYFKKYLTNSKRFGIIVTDKENKYLQIVKQFNLNLI